MTMTPPEATRLVYTREEIEPTEAEYLGGIREELVKQAKHLSEHQDQSRASLYRDTVKRLDEQYGVDPEVFEASLGRAKGRFVVPKAFLLGYTTANMQGILSYLEYSGQEAFKTSIAEAARKGVQPAEALVSFYAKLCYKSLVVGPNANVTQVRDIPGNIRGAQKQAHGSIFEHISLNLLVTDCSRVYTHEQTRHRVGTAYSQTSGRFCAIEPGTLQLVLDPILHGCEDLIEPLLAKVERTVYFIECRKGIRKPPFGLTPAQIPMDLTFMSAGEAVDNLGPDLTFPDDEFHKVYKRVFDPQSDVKQSDPEDLKAGLMWVRCTKEDGIDFDYKKKLTSAARRVAPNGQSNEMGMTLNVRTLRHTIMMRTARHAEWEIRHIFNQIYLMAKEKWPLMFADAKEREVDGLLEVFGMKMNPYERALTDYEDNELLGELYERGVLVAGIAPPIAAKGDELDLKLSQATGGEVIPAADYAKGSGAEELPESETGESSATD